MNKNIYQAKITHFFQTTNKIYARYNLPQQNHPKTHKTRQIHNTPLPATPTQRHPRRHTSPTRHPPAETSTGARRPAPATAPSPQSDPSDRSPPPLSHPHLGFRRSPIFTPFPPSDSSDQSDHTQQGQDAPAPRGHYKTEKASRAVAQDAF